MARDISARKLVEKTLRASEEQIRTLFDEASDGIAFADADTGTILDCNDALFQEILVARSGKLILVEIEPAAWS